LEILHGQRIDERLSGTEVLVKHESYDQQRGNDGHEDEAPFVALGFGENDGS
jgi:hypothetical protein